MTVPRNALRIALVSTPWSSVPPTGYGGIEAVCATLADGLVARGHHVVTIGPGSRGTTAAHVSTSPEPAGAMVGNPLPELVHAARAARIVDDLDVDVVHDHSLAGPLSAHQRAAPTILTAHHPPRGAFGAYYETFAGMVDLVAISAAQRRLAPDLPWLRTVPNAVDVDQVPFSAAAGDYAVWLGRTTPEKGAVQAIEVARRAGLRLVLAGRHNNQHERDYFDQIIRPLLGPDVEWAGEIGGADKWTLLGEAACLLFPVDWDEPFGMVMIEAMAAGTPVVALRRGAAPEVVAHGDTGFVHDDLDGLVEAIGRLGTIDRAVCRRHVIDHFDVAQMAEAYEDAYLNVIERSPMAGVGR